jgi:DNA-binding MarR family transcriptional regulator
LERKYAYFISYSESYQLIFGGNVCVVDKASASTLYLQVDCALRLLDQLYKPHFEALGLGVIEAYILLLLYEKDGQRPGDLARAVGRAPTSFTPILDKIQRKKLIKRKQDASDHRAVNIYLTKHGIKLQPQIQSAFEHVEQKVDQRLGVELRSAVDHLLLTVLNLPNSV